MKNKTIRIIAILSLMASALYGQEFKIAKSTGRLEINSGRVQVEGTSGNEIIFTRFDHDKDRDERAKGLNEINSLGLTDNTGLGINVTDKDNVITVRQLKKMNSPKIRIQVPKGVTVSFVHESQYGGEAQFKNVEGEIEVSAQYNSVELDNCSGPVTVKTIYGNVDATFEANTKGPISIVSVYGHVDVALPVAIKAGIKMATSYGEIYAAPDFKIEVDRSSEMVRHSDRVSGKINGGGIDIDLQANYGKIYLRKR
jgi:predicted membrane protein